MTDFSVTVLGTSSALFAHGRHQSALWVEHGKDAFLIDCGESTQLRVQQERLKTGKLKAIFISHLHGDHYYGLAGFLSTLGLQGRTSALDIYGPKGLGQVIKLQMQYAGGRYDFEMRFHTVSGDGSLIFETPFLTISTLPLDHSIETVGYLIKEKPRLRSLIKEKLPSSMNHAVATALRHGQDAFHEETGQLLKAADFCYPPWKQRSLAYCSDTQYVTGLSQYFLDVDLLYHEATFTNEYEDRARATKHSTAAMAAKVAVEARAVRLLVTHFSSRFADPTPILEEVRQVFPSADIAVEGQTYWIEDSQIV